MIEIFAFSYNLDIERTVSILKNGYIGISKESNWDIDFPGVYMSIITEEQNRIPSAWGYDIDLIFSVKLLKRSDYHINEEDVYGHLTEKSYSPNNLHLIKKIDVTSEIVFHNKVSTIFLESIVVKDYQRDFVYPRLKKYLHEEKIKFS